MDRRLALKFGLILLVIFTAFFKLAQHPVMRYDEARNGVNAMEMLDNGDYINLHYRGEPDNWNAKPPLFIWAKVVSLKIFGKSVFALRFPAALASLFTFLFLFRILQLYQKPTLIPLLFLLLLSVEGIYGPHVARTGDFDSFLLLFIIAGIYYFLKWVDFAHEKSLYYAAFAFGLAFWTKGPAFGIILPALLLYLLYQKKLKSLVTLAIFYRSVAIFLVFPISWFLMSYQYGYESTSIEHGATNAFNRLFVYDIFQRFFDTRVHESEYLSKPDFFLVYLDSHFNVWNYVFLAAIVFFIFKFIQNRKEFQKIQANKLLIFSGLVWSSMAIILTLTATNHRWYMTPALPFIAYTTAYFINFLSSRNALLKYLFALLLAFTFIRHKVDYFQEKTVPKIIAGNEIILKENPSLYISSEVHIAQEELYYLHLCCDKIEFQQKDKDIPVTNLKLYSTKETRINSNLTDKSIVIWQDEKRQIITNN